MKILVLLAVFAVFVVACSSAVLDLPSDDASVSVDTVGAGADVASVVDNGSTGTDTSGAGEIAVEVATQKPCVDKDNDGYCDASPLPGDCDDNNASVHPGAVELCDGIDNNCNGQVDEGCATPSIGNYLRVEYPNAAQRTLTVVVDSNMEPNGPYWNPKLTTGSSGTSVQSNLDSVPPPAAGQKVHVFFNVDVGNPPSSWFCDLNRGVTHPLDPNAKVTLKWGGKSLDNSTLTWMQSTQGGCAAQLDVQF